MQNQNSTSRSTTEPSKMMIFEFLNSDKGVMSFCVLALAVVVRYF
ncbi:hypothetical protein [Iodobacter fluviatilis]|nr:hypothetical protein [Iodobacter fluviatilis]